MALNKAVYWRISNEFKNKKILFWIKGYWVNNNFLHFA